MTDRIAALSTRTKMASLFSVPHIKNLVLTCQKNNRNESWAAISALKKLFVGDELIPDRKLMEFEDNLCELVRKMPKLFGLTKETDSDDNTDTKSKTVDPKDEITLKKLQLILHTEDSFKILYSAFVNTIITGAKDNV